MKVVLAALLAALLAAPAARASVPSGNLLANPGAEAGPGDPDSSGTNAPPGWTVEGNLVAVQYGAPSFPASLTGGGANFFAGGNAALSAGTQTVDVSGAAAEIDAGGVSATLSAALGGWASQTDSTTITATALNAAGAELGSFAIGPVTPEDRGQATELLPRSTTDAVPAGTRAIRVRMAMTRVDGAYDDGYADNVSLTLAQGGKSATGTAVSGKVLVKRPGGGFVELTGTQGIPFGSTVDARDGVIELADAAGKRARFYDGIFKLTKSGRTTVLTLTEALAPCKGARAAAKKPKSRKLWGDGSGSFRTRGQYSSATVRGTKWLVQDACSGTLTRVAKGVVTVRDEVKSKTIVVRAGRSYTARPRRR